MSHRRGRHRHQRERYPSGDPRRDGAEVIQATALAYREKEMVAAGLISWIEKERRGRNEREEADPLADPLNGFTLGLLRQRNKASYEDPSGINQLQFDAGEKWATLCRQHASLMGYSIGTTKSPSFMLVSQGLSCSKPPEDAHVIKVRRLWSDCYRILMDTGEALHQGARVMLVCWDVCVNNRRVQDLTQMDFGNLRAGLNGLARVLR